jgi:hypothetical protein
MPSGVGNDHDANGSAATHTIRVSFCIRAAHTYRLNLDGDKSPEPQSVKQPIQDSEPCPSLHPPECRGTVAKALG